MAMWFTPSTNVPIAILLSMEVFPVQNLATARHSLSIPAPLSSILSQQDLLCSLWGASPVIHSPLCNAPLAPVFEVSMMHRLPAQGQQIVEAIAQRYGVSTDAVITLLYALIAGNGTMAQFTHPELGGSGQWMQGGMTMVGDMFNNVLKAQVD